MTLLARRSRPVSPLPTSTLVVLLLYLPLVARLAPAQTMPAEGRAAMRQLEEEARKFAAGELELPERPDFAFRFDHEIERGFILRQLLRVHDRRRPAVDAYIRWQLLSYQPRLDEFESWDIQKLFATLPSLLVNPCAESDVLRRFELMVEAIEELPPEAQQQAQRYRALMQQEWQGLEQARDHAQRLNRAAVEYVTYWRDHLREIGGVTGPNEPRLAWAELLNTLKAGWPVRAEKGRLTRALNLRRGDESFTRRERTTLRQQIEGLVGVRYPVLDGADFPLEGIPRLRIGNRFISEDDAARWFEALDDLEKRETVEQSRNSFEPRQ